MPRRSTMPLALLLLLLTLVSAGSARAEDPAGGHPLLGGMVLGPASDRLSFSLGAFNIVPHSDRQHRVSGEGRVEYRSGWKWYGIGPLVGVMGETRGAVFGYAGLYADLAYGPWVVTPSAGAGAYARNGSRNLGGTFQFHLSIEAAYTFENASRLGIRWAHISNAGIHAHNPGADSLLVTYSVPLGF